MAWNYLHEIEYRHEVSKYERALIYSESVEDHGFCFHNKDMTRTEWHEHYTRLCAFDFLDRKSAKSGTWLVTAIRDRAGQRTTLCTVRIRWPADFRQ
jgi:hypothetical protein